MGYTTPNTFSAGTAAVAADVNANFTAINNWANGNIINSDISNDAAISVSKLAASKEHLLLTFPVVTDTTATGIKSYIPIYKDNNGDWTAVYSQWLCTDPGSAPASYQLKWGYYSGASVLTSANIGSAVSVSGSDAVITQGVSSIGATMAFDGNVRTLILDVTVGGTASGGLWVSVLLSRTISAS